MLIKDRIVRLDRIPANQLLPNPKNWRTQPDAQANALLGLRAEVGFANAVLARETPDGLMLIDGHLRAETTGDGIVPVVVLDVTEEETDNIRATHAKTPRRKEGRTRVRLEANALGLDLNQNPLRLRAFA